MDAIHHFFWVLAYIAAVGFLISGLDDFFFDLQFVRYLFATSDRPHITVQELKNKPEQWIAVFVPAWKEGGVVNRMAEYAVKVLLYQKYDIFIGVYPNDPETCGCVDKVVAACPRIHKVMVPHPGPTSKADCLNWVYRAMRLREIPGVREYGIVCLHDSEDILHPLTLKIYNWFVPDQLDMAQIPVFPLELNPWTHWVGNTYMDEFCELHIKDMYARQQIGGVVPSAGVGTAFGRRALEALGASNNGDAFRVGNLTEDYEIGIRLKRAGFRTAFVNYPVDRRVKRKIGGVEKEEIVTELVAVRENFPTEFGAAVKQRSRWILGIAFQTWEQTGWAGTIQVRYTLLRDRRAPLVHLINAVGYLVLVYAILNLIVVHTSLASRIYMKPLFDTSTLLWKLVIIDSCLLLYRFAQKSYCVSRVFGWKQSLFSIPRLVVGNAVNFFATIRALRMYIENRVLGKPLVWLKTTHVFPGQAELAEYSRSIEDLLVEAGLVSKEQVDAAERQRQGESMPYTLLRLGLIDETQFTEVWCRHSNLPQRLINPYDIPPDLLRLLPEGDAAEAHAIPLGREEDRVLVAFREPPDDARIARLAALLKSPIHTVLSRPSNIAFALNRAYPRLILPASSHQFFSELMRKSVTIPQDRFFDALHLQHLTRQSLADVLVDMGVVKQDEGRRLWSESIGCPPVSVTHVESDHDAMQQLGDVLCWLHRLVPLQGGQIAIASTVHPGLVQWIAYTLKRDPMFAGDLPRNVEVISRSLGMAFDADEKTMELLRTANAISEKDVGSLREMRLLVSDPVPVLVKELGMAGDDALHDAFLKLSRLPVAPAHDPAEVERLRPLLPPGFTKLTGCRAISESDGAVTLGLSRLLTARELLTIHERLTGYPIFFQALAFGDAQALKS